MDSRNIAILTESPNVNFGVIAKVAGAISRQVNDHLSRFWSVRASIAAYEKQADVPLGYWRVTVVSGRPEGLLGIHRDNNGEAYAFVSDEDHWSIAISHEILEMLVDPTLSNFRAGNLPNSSTRVNFLVEICDPCQSSAYSVNGIAVSDFVTPSYFDPDSAADAGQVQYSFQGSIGKPRTVAPGGYLVWLDPEDGKYYAYTSDGVTGRTISLGTFQGGMATTREWVDSILRKGIPLSPYTKKRLDDIQIAHDKACSAQAKRWVAAINQRGKSMSRSTRRAVKKLKQRRKPKL